MSTTCPSVCTRGSWCQALAEVFGLPSLRNHQRHPVLYAARARARGIPDTTHPKQQAYTDERLIAGLA